MRVIESFFESLAWLWISIGIIGAFMVIVGVWGEGRTEKMVLPYHRQERLKNRYWRILLCGLAFDVVGLIGSTLTSFTLETKVASLEFAKAQLQAQITQTVTNLANADPRNLPIQRILGRIRVEVKPPFTNFAANLHLRPIYQNPALPLSDEEELKKQESVFLQFGKHSDDDFGSLIPVVGWIGSMRYFEGISKTNDGDIRFDIFFDSDRSGSPVWNPKGVRYNELNLARFWISNEWPPPQGIVGGQVELLVNGLWSKTFAINPQTNNNFPYRVTTTNLIAAPQN